jgi:hypothetical protein
VRLHLSLMLMGPASMLTLQLMIRSSRLRMPSILQHLCLIRASQTLQGQKKLLLNPPIKIYKSRLGLVLTVMQISYLTKILKTQTNTMSREQKAVRLRHSCRNTTLNWFKITHYWRISRTHLQNKTWREQGLLRELLLENSLTLKWVFSSNHLSTSKV